ncbi:MAG: hypothetical protein WAN29_18460 [Candidatus Sulfotelmatobacter sp.]
MDDLTSLNMTDNFLGHEVQAMGQAGEAKKVWVTLTGLPLTITLEWPFHRSTSGADFWVLHGDIRLENSDGLHAPVAVNLSATVREVVASLEPEDVEAPVINALRKEVDHRQIEFVKSGKLKPVAFSSRHYDFKRGKWVFGKASDEVIAEFLERKVYWGAKGSTEYRVPSTQGGGSKVWIGDPTEAQYLENSPARLLEIAGRLAGNGLLRIEGEWAEATAGLMGRAERFEAAMQTAVEALEKKHAFERG